MTKTKYLIIEIVALFFFVATIITNIMYSVLGNAYTYKTIASCCFVLCALVNFILMLSFKTSKSKKFIVFMLIGQIFACLGDILLIDYFEIGAGLFAIGHIFYFIAYCTLKPFKLIDLIYIGISLGISLIIIFVSNLSYGSMLPLVIAYAVIISIMLAKSATLISDNFYLGIYLFAGSLMFYLSDMFLMFNMFGNIGRIGGILCLGFYYPAQYLLAMSITVVSIFVKDKKGIKHE